MNQGNYGERVELTAFASSRFGYYSALLTVILTIVSFGFALYAVPISGANCPGNCVEYPYLDTVARFPRGFMWMPLAILLVLAYMTLMVSIHTYASHRKKAFSQAGLSSALMAATMLASVYFIQFSVIPISLMKGETEGLAALIQYNPHGVFIAMEELGYLLMSLSLLFYGAGVCRKEPPRNCTVNFYQHVFPGDCSPDRNLIDLWTGATGSLRGRGHLD